jgi:aminoglycoside phosphotransferase (APT) family kinase protein
MIDEPGRDDGGTTRVREGFEFNRDHLHEWLSSHVEGYAGPLQIEQFKGGQSNPTYKLITPGCNYVLRKKPVGALLKGAHAIDREAAAMLALEPVGFPVAHVFGQCTDISIIGASFYVMSCIEGRIFWDASFPDVAPGTRAAYFDAMNLALAQLHSIDHLAAGLGAFGRPGNYLSRQLSLWTKQYTEDALAGRDPHMDRLIEWLPLHIPPAGETRIVHGDFRCDNLIFHGTEPRIMAVLDWELSTIGDPLVDFASHAMMFRMPPQFVAGLANSDIRALGIPSESEYVAAYCRRTGRSSIPEFDYYVAFNFFRLAAIFHGIKGRVARGTAASLGARRRAESFPDLAALAWHQAQRAGV